MKKRIWNKVVSIFTAILLVVGIVPNTTITALAAAPDGQVLYVGGVQISSTGYWTTDSDGNVTNAGATQPSDNYIHYDEENNVLTLHNATIKKELNYNTSIEGGTFINGSAIGVFNQFGNAELTINLEGTNTIANVSKGIFVLAISASTDSSNLTIQGDGSLDTSGFVNPGICVQSNSGNASLSIQNTEVTATSAYDRGVTVQADSSSSASLTVEGGSLTATGGSSSGLGIYFYGPSSSNINLNVSNNALVRANGGIASGTNADEAVTTDGIGIVFNGNEGTVYGSVELQEDLTIGDGESLTLDDGASLNAGNHNVIVDGGTLNGEDKITGTVKYTPSITTASLPEGKVNEEYDAFLTADGSEPIEWSVIQEDSLPTGLSLSKDGKITGKPTAPGDYVFTVTASNDVGSVSKELTITVKDVDPIYSIQNSGDINFADAIESYTPEVKTIMITNDGNQPITLNQPVSSESFEVGTLSKTTLSVGETAEFTVQPKNGLLAGSYDEDIKITGTNNGQSVSTKVNVKFNVKHNAVKVESKDPTCTEKGNIEYWYCEACRKYFQDEALTKELKQEETILPATGHNLTKVDEKKPTVDAAGNIEYWYCEVCNKYFSDEKAEHEITLEDTIIAKLPKFVSGANQEWTKGSKDGLTFKIDTDIKEFKKVLVDGKELKDTDYDIKSGSTILTLKPSFLDALSAGKHKIRFEFNTGSVEAYFTVKDKENSSQTESANTGVQNKYGLWIVLLLVAAGGLAGFGILSKRRKNHK